MVYYPTMPTKVDRLIKVLDSLPDDEVLTVVDVMPIIEVNRRETIYDWARRNVKLSFYHCMAPSPKGPRYIFGNPRAIIAARKHLTTIGE